MAHLRSDLEDELWLWRVAESNFTTLAEMKSGAVSLSDCLRIVAIMNVDACQEMHACAKARSEAKR